MSRGASDVFLLSTTNGAESSGLAAAIATAAFYREHDVIKALKDAGDELLVALLEAAGAFDLDGLNFYSDFFCRPRLLRHGQPLPVSFYRTLCAHGVLWPPNWTCACFRHDADDFNQVETALFAACEQLAQTVTA